MLYGIDDLPCATNSLAGPPNVDHRHDRAENRVVDKKATCHPLMWSFRWCLICLETHRGEHVPGPDAGPDPKPMLARATKQRMRMVGATLVSTGFRTKARN